MVRDITVWADSQAHITMALSYWKASTSKEEVLAQLKGNHYLYNNFKYRATTVVAHMELLDRLDTGAREGHIHTTKKNGLTY